jgi:hypothetical protein
MKKNFLLSAILSFSFLASTYAQEADHVIKLNLFSLPLKNLSFQYEKPFADNFSFALGLNYRMPGSLNRIDNIMSEQHENAQTSSRISGFGFTPELRIYFSGNAPKGFYLAPYLRYSNYRASIEGLWEPDNTGTIVPLVGSFNSFGGGAMIGAQWLIAGKFSIDWWIIGAHYGVGNFSLSGEREDRPFNAGEINDIENTIVNVNELPFTNFDNPIVENNNRKVSVTGKFPVPGIRTGLCIGWAF